LFSKLSTKNLNLRGLIKFSLKLFFNSFIQATHAKPKVSGFLFSKYCILIGLGLSSLSSVLLIYGLLLGL
jgi:hypothetical protein